MHTRLTNEMPYTLSYFQSWVSGHSSWDSLRTWLTSAEGGFLRVVEPNHSPYACVRYVKGTSTMNLPHVPWCRSVIVHKDSRLVVSVSPPKASSLDSLDVETVTSAEEFVDGTMLHGFKMEGVDPELATRSRVGANVPFYDGAPSFADMIFEAFAQSGVQTLEDSLPVANGSIAVHTSFVVQHPKNRLVKTIATPSFVIVHQGRTDADGTVHIEEDSCSFRCISTAQERIQIIVPYNLESIRAAKTVEDWVAKRAQTQGYAWQGLVLKDGKGNRWRIRSQVYETVRRMRGNESSMEERFARIRKERTQEQYCTLYPEERTRMYELEGVLRSRTRTLFQLYGDVFRAKRTEFHTLPWPFKYHVSRLHNIYKETLRPEKATITLEHVIQYVNQCPVEDWVHLLKSTAPPKANKKQASHQVAQDILRSA